MYQSVCYDFVYNIFICIQKYVFLLYILFYLYNIYGAYSISLEGILNIHRVHATACTPLREAYWRGMALCIHAENTCLTSLPGCGCLPTLFATTVLWLFAKILSN